MESWGCEFLDILVVQEFVQYKKKKDTSIINISSDIIQKMLNKPAYENMKINDFKYIEQLKLDIMENGLLKPGQVTVGTNGATLSDGNHRFAACMELQYESFPVRVHKSNNPIKVGGIKSGDFIMELLRIINE